MTDPHHHDHGTTRVVEDRGGPAGILIALAVIVLIGFLIWLFAFSGIVFDTDGGNGGTEIEQEIEPGGGTGDGGTGDGGTGDGGDTQPSP